MAINFSESPVQPYQAGDSLSFTGYDSFSAFVSGGGVNLFVSIPLSKPCTATDFSVSGIVNARDSDGYILNTFAVSDSVLQYKSVDASGLHFAIVPGSWSRQPKNNIACSMQPQSITITLS